MNSGSLKPALLGLILFASSAYSFAATCQAPNAETLSAIVRVSSNEGDQSSGVIIDQNRVITVAHAVNVGHRTEVEIDEVFYEAQIIALNPGKDLALLSVPTAQVKPLTLSTIELLQQDPVWLAAYPLALELSTSFGRYQRRMNGRLYTTTQANAGSSGGGLLRCNDTGEHELAGVVHGYVAYYNGEKYINSGDATSVTAKDIRDLSATQTVNFIP